MNRRTFFMFALAAPASGPAVIWHGRHECWPELARIFGTGEA